MNIELKPCPFCGNEHLKVGTEKDFDPDMPYPSTYVAVCCCIHQGGCGAVSGFKPIMQEAVELWNMRK